MGVTFMECYFLDWSPSLQLLGQGLLGTRTRCLDFIALDKSSQSLGYVVSFMYMQFLLSVMSCAEV